MRQAYFKRFSQIGMIISLGAILILACEAEIAQAEKNGTEVKTTSTDKSIQGEITGIGKNYIAVTYEMNEEKGTEYEILLPVDKDLQLVHKNKFSELNIGDTVRIKYEEITEEYAETNRKLRKAKVITFVKPAEKKPENLDSIETLISH
ncbi:hypothetical protein ACFL1D_05295 [Candidatus Omnitrophota bacterium]